MVIKKIVEISENKNPKSNPNSYRDRNPKLFLIADCGFEIADRFY